MTTTVELLAAHPFLDGLPEGLLSHLASFAKRRALPAGTQVFREGGNADHFWLIREGRIALEFGVAGRGNIIIEELGPGTALGWSWLFAPYRWKFGAIAAEPSLAIEFDAAGVRRLCTDYPVLGYQLTHRFAAVLADRLSAARLRLVELYGYPTEAVS